MCRKSRLSRVTQSWQKREKNYNVDVVLVWFSFSNEEHIHDHFPIKYE